MAEKKRRKKHDPPIGIAAHERERVEKIDARIHESVQRRLHEIEREKFERERAVKQKIIIDRHQRAYSNFIRRYRHRSGFNSAWLDDIREWEVYVLSRPYRQRVNGITPSQITTLRREIWNRDEIDRAMLCDEICRPFLKSQNNFEKIAKPLGKRGRNSMKKSA